jgi:hypothetical protein
MDSDHKEHKLVAYANQIICLQADACDLVYYQGRENIP